MRTALVLVLGTVLLAACGQNPPPPAAVTPAPVAAAPVAATTAPAPLTAEGHLWFEPAGLRKCDTTPQAVTVFWDARGLPGKGPIELIAIGGKGKEVKFAVVGRVGKRDTGAWVFPGTAIVMRNQADGTELVRARIKPIPCT